MFSPKAFTGGGAKTAQKTEETMKMSDPVDDVGFKMNFGSDDSMSRSRMLLEGVGAKVHATRT